MYKDTRKRKTTNAPSVILRIEGLKADLKLLLFNIADLTKKNVIINQELLSYMGGCSVSSIKRYLNELEKKGYIIRDTKFIDKKKQTKYMIQWDMIDKYSTDKDFLNEKPCNVEKVEIIPDEEPQSIGQFINEYKEEENMGNCIGTLQELKTKTKTEQQQQEKINNSSTYTIPWNEYKKEYGYIIKQIIEDFNSESKIREKQGRIRLQELLNRRYSKPYTERILDVINSNINNVYNINT